MLAWTRSERSTQNVLQTIALRVNRLCALLLSLSNSRIREIRASRGTSIAPAARFEPIGAMCGVHSCGRHRELCARQWRGTVVVLQRQNEDGSQ